jgi:hypothetical protein
MARTKGSAEPSTLAAPGRPAYAAYLLLWARGGCVGKLLTWPEFSDKHQKGAS